MQIGNKEIKEIVITDQDGNLVASITDDDVIGIDGYTITLV